MAKKFTDAFGDTLRVSAVNDGGTEEVALWMTKTSGNSVHLTIPQTRALIKRLKKSIKKSREVPQDG